MSKEDAARFTEGELETARLFMAAANSAKNMTVYRENRNKALFHFGMAMHPIMDAISPSHKWSVYRVSTG